MSPYEKRALWVAVLLHIIAAWFSVGHHHPDEHYQLVEFANYKLGRTPLSMLPWEFAAGMRPGLQPFIIYLLLKAYYGAGLVHPFYFSFILRLLSGFAALFTAWRFHLAIKDRITSVALQKAHLLLSLLGWGLVYLHIRASSENWSAMCFAFAVICMLPPLKKQYFWFGIWAGLSFVFRFQSGFFVAGAGLWMLFAERSSRKQIMQTAGGFLLVFGVGILADYWLYGHFTLSSWAYLDQNIFQHKAASFGTEPWYWYLEQLFNLTIPPFSLLLVLCIPIMIIYRPKDIITWSCAAFLIAHCAVGHKEFRFLFPMAFFVPYLVVCVLAYIHEKWPALSGTKAYQKLAPVLITAFWIINWFALALMSLKPASDQMALNNYLYDHIKTPTILIYSTPLSPYVADQQKAYFYKNNYLRTYCIDEVMEDTALLAGKHVLLFSEHAFKKDEFIFQFAPSFFDSSRATLFHSNLPQWLYQFNYNNWLERSNVYSIYELNTKR